MTTVGRMPGHGRLLQNAGPFGGLGYCKRDLFPSSTRRSAAPPNGNEGCATEVAQTKEDRGRRKKKKKREEEKEVERLKGRESRKKKKKKKKKQDVIHKRYS